MGLIIIIIRSCSNSTCHIYTCTYASPIAAEATPSQYGIVLLVRGSISHRGTRTVLRRTSCSSAHTKARTGKRAREQNEPSVLGLEFEGGGLSAPLVGLFLLRGGRAGQCLREKSFGLVFCRVS